MTGGCDNLVKFWSNEKSLQSVDDGRNNILGTKFTCETYEGHSDWVRDVAWLNHIGLPYDIVASCGEVKLTKRRIILYTYGQRRKMIKTGKKKS